MKRVIEISGDITMETGIEVVKLILDTVQDEEIDTIVFFIASNGGNLETVSPIFEALKMAGKKTVAIGLQRVMSAASAIFMMADRRILFPYTGFMVHKSVLTFEELGLDKAKFNVKSYEKLSDWLLEVTRSKSTIPEATLKRKVANDQYWYFTPEEIVKYNIVTEEFDTEKVKELLTEDIG